MQEENRKQDLPPKHQWHSDNGILLDAINNIGSLVAIYPTWKDTTINDMDTPS